MNLHGRKKPENIYSLTQNLRELEYYLGFKSQNTAGIKIKDRSIIYDERFQEFLNLFRKGYGATIDVKPSNDSIWTLVKHRDLNGAVEASYMIHNTIKDRGREDYLKYSLFKFDGKYTLYLVFRYDSCRFYPFIPLNRSLRIRNEDEELKVASLIGKKIPFEKSIKKWEPVWDVPV